MIIARRKEAVFPDVLMVNIKELYNEPFLKVHLTFTNPKALLVCAVNTGIFTGIFAQYSVCVL